jgi:dTDP-4-amino-4,6-dideoxygalactose transaminase
LDDVSGIAVQAIPPGDASTYKDFCIIVDPGAFGMTRDDLVKGLAAEGVDTRNYFDPPVHRQQAYRETKPGPLPVTDDVCSRVTSLPMFGRLPLESADRVVECIRGLHDNADEVVAALTSSPATPGT